MKSKYWIIVLAALLALCLGASLLLTGGSPAGQAQISSEGKVVRIVDLLVDQEFTVTASDGGTNTVTVSNGKIAVTAASCPDHYCMDRGFCNSGTQIVCLPNRLVIAFLDEQMIDGIVG